MNKRIELLAEQAGCGWWEGRALRDMTRCHIELEKFAELLIEECARIADQADADKCESIGDNIKFQMGYKL